MKPTESAAEELPAAPSLGQQLRAARIARGWSAQDVGGRLRLRAPLVEALECADYAPFKAATYARGQLRNYVRLLGLDEDKLLAQFRAPDLVSGDAVLRRASELHPRRPWLVRLGALAIVSALAVLGALWAGTGRTPLPVAPGAADLPPDTRTPPGSETTAEPTAQPATVPEAAAAPAAQSSDPTTTVSPPPAASTIDGALSPPSPTAVTGAPDGVELRLRSRAVSWVEVTDHRGQRLIYELVSPGLEKVVHGAPPLRVLLGNAQAVEVLFAGKAVAMPAGQHVVRLTLGEPAADTAHPSAVSPPATPTI